MLGPASGIRKRQREGSPFAKTSHFIFFYTIMPQISLKKKSILSAKLMLGGIGGRRKRGR